MKISFWSVFRWTQRSITQRRVITLGPISFKNGLKSSARLEGKKWPFISSFAPFGFPHQCFLCTVHLYDIYGENKLKLKLKLKSHEVSARKNNNRLRCNKKCRGGQIPPPALLGLTWAMICWNQSLLSTEDKFH